MFYSQDASKYVWACVLTQEKTHIMEEKEVRTTTSHNLYEWTIQR